MPDPTDVLFPMALVEDIASYLSARPYSEVAPLFERMSAAIKQQFAANLVKNETKEN